MFSHSFKSLSSRGPALCERSPLTMTALLGILTSIGSDTVVGFSSFADTSTSRLEITTLMELGSSALICTSNFLQIAGWIYLSSPTNFTNKTVSLSETIEISFAFIVWSPVHPSNLNKNVPGI